MHKKKRKRGETKDKTHCFQNLHPLLGPHKHGAVLVERGVDDVLFGGGARADGPHLELHLFAQERLAQTCVQTHAVVALDQRDAERRRDELLDAAATAASCAAATSSASCAASAPCGSSSGGGVVVAGSWRGLDIFAFFDFGNMFGHGGIGTDTVGIHEADELGFGQVSWGACLAICDVGFSGFKGFV